jgi:hypothetical protein
MELNLSQPDIMMRTFGSDSLVKGNKHGSYNKRASVEAQRWFSRMSDDRWKVGWYRVLKQ